MNDDKAGHAAVREEHLIEIVSAGLAPRIGEDFIDPSFVRVLGEIGIVEVKETTMLVAATVSVLVQDGVEGNVVIELDRWDPTRGRFVSFDN